VLATGSRVRKLTLPGSDLAGLFYVRTIQDIEQIRGYVARGKKAVVVGAGYIGLETAAMLCQLGMDVTILESADRILARVTCETISAFFDQYHRNQGVNILTGVSLQALEGTNKITHVRLADGTRLEADLVIAGIGITPETELAEMAGLTLRNGIEVNELTQTSHPDIYAVGDCACHYNKLYQRWIRLESVQNAMDQGRTCAEALVGKAKPHEALPWFWSDQYDLKLQIAGLSEGYDQQVLRPHPEDNNTFSLFYLKGNRILSLDAINQPRDFMLGKRLIAEQIEIDPERLADPGFALNEFINQS